MKHSKFNFTCVKNALFLCMMLGMFSTYAQKDTTTVVGFLIQVDGNTVFSPYIILDPKYMEKLEVVSDLEEKKTYGLAAQDCLFRVATDSSISFLTLSEFLSSRNVDLKSRKLYLNELFVPNYNDGFWIGSLENIEIVELEDRVILKV